MKMKMKMLLKRLRYFLHPITIGQIEHIINISHLSQQTTNIIQYMALEIYNFKAHKNFNPYYKLTWKEFNHFIKLMEKYKEKE